MAEEMYSFMAPMASAKMISDTLSRLCELGILFSSLPLPPLFYSSVPIL